MLVPQVQEVELTVSPREARSVCRASFVQSPPENSKPDPPDSWRKFITQQLEVFAYFLDCDMNKICMDF